MRKAGWWFASFLAIVLCSATFSSANLLQNPSFEEVEMQADNPYGDLAAFWGRWGHWMNRETGWKPTQSGKCLMGYHHWQIESPETSGFYQDVDEVAEGAECVFSIYVAKDKDTNAESIELRIEKSGGFETLGSAFFSVAELKGRGYNQILVRGRAAEEGVRVTVVVNPSKSAPRKGALKFDDASLIAE